MSNVDDLVKEINEEIKSYKKYESKPKTQDVDLDLGAKTSKKKSWFKKEQIPYLLIPLVVIFVLAYFKPKFLYDIDTTNDTKKLNLKKAIFTVLILSGIVVAVYYFYIQNLF